MKEQVMMKDDLSKKIEMYGYFSSKFTLNLGLSGHNSTESSITAEGNQFECSQLIPLDDGFKINIFGKIEIGEYLDAMARLLEKAYPGSLLRIISQGDPIPDQTTPVKFEDVENTPWDDFPSFINQLPKRSEGINQNE